MVDTRFERMLETAMQYYVLDKAMVELQQTLDSLSDAALQHLFGLVIMAKMSNDHHGAEARERLDELLGKLSDDHYKLVASEIEAAFERRYGPVPGR